MGTGKPRAARATSGWEAYVALVRRHLHFLEDHGYAEPRVWTAMRECSIVYRSDARAIIDVLDDFGSEPIVRVVPRDLVNRHGSPRSFGLREAAPVIAPGFGPAPPQERDVDAWFRWYASLLRGYLDAITRPSPSLLDAIEARRPPPDGCT